MLIWQGHAWLLEVVPYYFFLVQAGSLPSACLVRAAKMSSFYKNWNHLHQEQEHAKPVLLHEELKTIPYAIQHESGSIALNWSSWGIALVPYDAIHVGPGPEGLML